MEITPITLSYFFEMNNYHLKTEKGHILIDTGIKKRRKQLEEELQAAGCKPGNIDLIIITHGHTDHVGNATYLRDKYETKIAMHRGDTGMVETGNMFANVKGGIMIGVVGAVMKLFGLSDYERFTPDIFLEDNQDLSVYGLKAKVIHTPGHSKGSICVLTSEGDLFCGDLFDNTKKPGKASMTQDRDKLEASVEKLGALGIETVYPGHGKPFKIEQLVP